MRATKAIIHLENLRHNIRLVRRHIGPEKRICMAVKADAYGHGVHRIVQTALSEGVESFAIATVQEGIDIRTEGVEVPILLLSLPLPEELPEVIRHDLTPLVTDRRFLRVLEDAAAAQGRRIGVHLKVDTGMGRIGCFPEDAVELATLTSVSRWLQLAGVCTHFPVADLPGSAFTEAQTERFAAIVEAIRSKGIDPGLVHAANSGAVLGYPAAHFDMVRPGILLYGYYPSQEQPRSLPVRPVMELESRIVFLKRVARGTPISYGMTYLTDRETTIATIPVGYGDGYSRLLSGRGEVLVDHKRYPIVGRICMDQLMVDLGTDPDVELYDRVTLFGPNPNGPDAESIATLIGTIPYEVTCDINKRVPRLYTDSADGDSRP